MALVKRPKANRRSFFNDVSRYFERGTAPENGVLLDLVRSPPTSWRDLPGAGGLHDWRWDAAPGTWTPGVDYRAPTCAVCHMSGAGDIKTRNAWRL